MKPSLIEAPFELNNDGLSNEDRSDDDKVDPTEAGGLYTPAMLAELLRVPIRNIRRWQRAGLLEPITEVKQLPHFDYSGLLVARQLAEWTAQGATVLSLQLQLEALRSRLARDVSIEELPITAEGKHLVLHHGDQYFEASGQLRFGFEPEGEPDDAPITLQFRTRTSGDRLSGSPTLHQSDDEFNEHLTLEAMVDEAIQAEDDDDLEVAIRWYRCALSAHGPNPDICFQLAELLYRCGDANGARERYFMAVELNPDLVEARANLGCVLAECGQLDLAIAAFEGALAQFADYSDVHFHLARTLDEAGERDRAVQHWQEFLTLAPASPWAEEAEHRLAQCGSLLDL